VHTNNRSGALPYPACARATDFRLASPGTNEGMRSDAPFAATVL